MKLLHVLLVLLAIVLLFLLFKKQKTGNIQGKVFTQSLNIMMNGDGCQCERQTCVDDKCETKTDDCGCDN